MPNEELTSLAERLEQLIDDVQSIKYQAKFAASEDEENVCKADLIKVWTYVTAAERHLQTAQMVASKTGKTNSELIQRIHLIDVQKGKEAGA